MKSFLFPFVFEKMTIDINITRWLKERKINYFYDMNIIYADVFGTDEFYRIEAEHVVGNVYEVFFCPDRKKEYPFPTRRFPTKEMVHPIPNVSNTVTVTFPNGDHITTEISGDKISVESFYLNSLFQVNKEKNDFQKAISVEFLSTTWEGMPVIDRSPRVISFTTLFPNEMGKKLDQYFSVRGWNLEYRPAVAGYQVFFGKGVQVDNQYEYGFPYSYSKDEITAFATRLYNRSIR